MKKIIFIFITILTIFCFCVGCTNKDMPYSVTDYNITVNLNWYNETSSIDGKYTGNLINNTPTGEGLFYAENDYGAKITYNGSFDDGAFNGYGQLVIDDNEEHIEIKGTFTNGEFTPSVGESFNFIGQLDLFGKYYISDDIIEFIDSHGELFPTSNKDVIQSIDLKEFSNKQFTKTRKQDDIGLIKLDLYALQVFEDDFINGKLTSILAVDDESNYYSLYYLDTVEIYSDDYFTAYGIPCSTSSFDNIGGGTTNVIVILASYFE